MSEPLTTLTVIRHGETVWNAEARLQGQTDAPLSALGLAQAQAVAAALAGESFAALYSSDLGRARHTARMVAARVGLDVVADVRLRERHLGIMQGLTMAEFLERWPQEHARFHSGDPDFIIPGGESLRQRHERAVAYVAEIAARHAGGRVLIITHGGILSSLFRHALGLGIAVPRRFSLYNGAINIFTITEGEWHVDRWGDIHHLPPGTQDDT